MYHDVDVAFTMLVVCAYMLFMWALALIHDGRKSNE